MEIRSFCLFFGYLSPFSGILPGLVTSMLVLARNCHLKAIKINTKATFRAVAGVLLISYYGCSELTPVLIDACEAIPRAF